MVAIEEARPLGENVCVKSSHGRRDTDGIWEVQTYPVITSWNIHIPRTDESTPRTAEDTM